MAELNNIFGFELLQQLHDSKIQKKEDVLVLFVHWYFVKHGLKCIGFGDSKAFDTSDRGSELLPKEWNTHSYYALRYLKDGKLYILHATKSDEDLLFNLLDAERNKTSVVHFHVNRIVHQLHGPLESIIPSYQAVISNLQKDLIGPIVPADKQDASIQVEQREPPGPIDVGPSPAQRQDPLLEDQRRFPELDPRSVGARDLDPFRAGGGMIFDPIRRGPPPIPGRPGLGVPGRLPPGAVPPGARFDPFGPPDLNPRRLPSRDPDNDHFPPPGYDDMFI